MEVVSGDLLILDNAPDHEFVDSVGDGLLLVFGLPEEAVHLDRHDHLEELVEVGLSLVGLHFPQNEGLSNRSFLDFLSFFSIFL